MSISALLFVLSPSLRKNFQYISIFSSSFFTSLLFLFFSLPLYYLRSSVILIFPVRSGKKDTIFSFFTFPCLLYTKFFSFSTWEWASHILFTSHFRSFSNTGNFPTNKNIVRDIFFPPPRCFPSISPFFLFHTLYSSYTKSCQTLLFFPVTYTFQSVPLHFFLQRSSLPRQTYHVNTRDAEPCQR